MSSPRYRYAQRPLFSFAVAAAISVAGCNMVSGPIMNAEGRSFYKEGNYALAQSYFSRAVNNQPNNPDYLHNLASAMHKRGDIVGAERVYRHTLQIDPAHQPTYHHLASLLRDQGRVPEALDLLTAWSATQPYNSASHLELAWLQRETGDPIGAEVSLQQAARLSPNDPRVLAHQGQIYQDLGDNQRAVAMYRRSLAANWYQPKVHSRLTSLQGSPGSYDAESQRLARLNNGNQGTFVAAQPMYRMPQGAGPQMAFAMPQTYAAPTNAVVSSTPRPTQTAAVPATGPVFPSGAVPVIPVNADPAHAGPATAHTHTAAMPVIVSPY